MAHITQKQIADACGVSLMTVSRALRYRGRPASSETFKKIQAKADELGYRPDPAMSALVAHRMAQRPISDYNVIGYISYWPKNFHLERESAVSASMEGARRRGAHLGFDVQLFCVPEHIEHHLDLSRILVSRGISGLLLCPLPSLDIVPDLDWDRFSVVAIGYSILKPIFTFVASHHTYNLSLIFENLRRLGYRRPALVLNPWADERTCHQLAGSWYLEQQSYKPEDRIPIFSLPEGHLPSTIKKLISEHHPDVIIDSFPLGELALKAANIKVPEDVGYVNLFVSANDQVTSGIYQNFTEIGGAAVDQLSILMNRGETGPCKVRSGFVRYGEWHAGKTLRG